jgi:hypothetical protein
MEMLILIYIVLIACLIACLIIATLKCGEIARNNGRSYAKWAWLSVFITPLIVPLLLIGLGPTKERKKKLIEEDEEIRYQKKLSLENRKVEFKPEEPKEEEPLKEEESSLNSITIPDSVTTIEHAAVYERSGLTSITIPDSVTSIGSRHFVNWTNLKSVTIGNSVTTIGEGAFYGCSSLRNVVVLNATPPSITSGTAYSDTFGGFPLGSATLTVPQGSKPAYQSAAGWNQFGTIVESIEIAEECITDEDDFLNIIASGESVNDEEVEDMDEEVEDMYEEDEDIDEEAEDIDEDGWKAEQDMFRESSANNLKTNIMGPIKNTLLETLPADKEEIKKLIDYIERNFKFNLSNYAATVKHRDDPFSDEHIQSVYIVVKEWYRNPFGTIQLLDFGSFKASILANKETIQELKKYRLEYLNSGDVITIEKGIAKLFKGLELVPVGKKSKLVVFSMTMHLLLPDLLMPINRTQTLKFFYDSMFVPVGDEGQIQIYIDIFEQMQEYSRTLTPKGEYLKPNGWSRNVPKLIDSLIIAYVKKEKENNNK